VSILNNVIDPTRGERTRLNYIIDEAGPVTITVFTLDGDVVQTLQRGRQNPGDYTVNWDGRNRAGNSVARGIYFIRIVAPGIDEIRKVMVVKN
jgi:flagellar hook assembly protein FlgD